MASLLFLCVAFCKHYKDASFQVYSSYQDWQRNEQPHWFMATMLIVSGVVVPKMFPLIHSVRDVYMAQYVMNYWCPLKVSFESLITMRRGGLCCHPPGRPFRRGLVFFLPPCRTNFRYFWVKSGLITAKSSIFVVLKELGVVKYWPNNHTPSSKNYGTKDFHPFL